MSSHEGYGLCRRGSGSDYGANIDVYRTELAASVSWLPPNRFSTNEVWDALNYRLKAQVACCQRDRYNEREFYVQMRTQGGLEELLQLDGRSLSEICDTRLRVEPWGRTTQSSLSSSSSHRDTRKLSQMSSPANRGDDELDTRPSKRSRELPPCGDSSRLSDGHASSLDDRLVFLVRTPSGCSDLDLLDGINRMMKDFGLSQHGSVVEVKRPNSLDGAFARHLIAESEKAAIMLLCLNGEKMHGISLTLYRNYGIKPDPSLTLYIKMKEKGNVPPLALELWEFIDQQMKFYGLSTTNESIYSCYRYPGRFGIWILIMKTEKLCEQCMCLNGISFQKLKLRIELDKAYQGPPPKYSNFGKFLADFKGGKLNHSNEGASPPLFDQLSADREAGLLKAPETGERGETSSRKSDSIMGKGKDNDVSIRNTDTPTAVYADHVLFIRTDRPLPQATGSRMKNFIDNQLHKLGFHPSSSGGVISCIKASRTEWKIRFARPKLAYDAMNLNGINFTPATLYVRRHPDFKGESPPMWPNYHAYVKFRREQVCEDFVPVHHHQPPIGSALERGASVPGPVEERPAHIDDESLSQMTASVHETVPRAISAAGPPQRLLSFEQQQEILQSRNDLKARVDVLEAKQEDGELRKDVARLARENNALKQQNAELTAQNNQLKAAAKGSEEMPIALDDSERDDENVDDVKDMNKEAFSKLIESKTKLDAALSELEGAKYTIDQKDQALMSIHEDWQCAMQDKEGHEQTIANHKQTIESLLVDLESTNAVLELERTARRALGDDLKKERQAHSKTKIQLRILQGLKQEQEEQVEDDCDV